MAKKITKTQEEATPKPLSEQVYSGSFIGDLTGNADTATRLKNNFTVSMTGDASGMFSTLGNSTQFAVTVAHSAMADKALHADTAGSVQQAQTAQLAARAQEANSAATAGHATSSDVAKHSETSSSADTAVNSQRAEYAAYAERAKTADTATLAARATEADRAVTADRLTDPDTPVPHADFADRAGVAEIALYDCLGQSIKDFYALKSDLIPYKEMLTLACAKDLFVPREEQILQAVVRGKAVGRGTVNGNTLEIFIDCAQGGDGWNVYNDIVYKTAMPAEEDADTTKIYVDNKGIMHLWNGPERIWKTVNGALSAEDEQRINDLLDKVTDLSEDVQEQFDNTVKLTGDQTVAGRKKFTDLIEAEIPTAEDGPRAVAVMHNLADLKKSVDIDLGKLEDELRDEISSIEDALKAQQVGLIQFAYKDYTVKANQAEMAVGVAYLGYQDADKQYIQIDPSTNKPADLNAKVEYIRHYLKDSSGSVTWFDVDTTPDMEGYAKLTGAEFTGPVKVPSLPLVTNDTRVFNSQDIQQLFLEAGKNVDNKLEDYMPVSGGNFTGDITVPYAADAETADPKVVLNKKNILDLISNSSVGLTLLESLPADTEELKPFRFYAFPAVIDPNEVQSVRLFAAPVDDSEVADQEIVFFKSDIPSIGE